MINEGKNKEVIKRNALFLEKRGYVISEGAYSVDYTSKREKISVNIIYAPNPDGRDIYIRFLDRNEVFSVSWIAFIREGISGNDDKWEELLQLLKYVQENYDDITDYDFCLQSRELIDQYVAENQSKFRQSVQKFLQSNGMEI